MHRRSSISSRGSNGLYLTLPLDDSRESNVTTIVDRILGVTLNLCRTLAAESLISRTRIYSACLQHGVTCRGVFDSNFTSVPSYDGALTPVEHPSSAIVGRVGPGFPQSCFKKYHKCALKSGWRMLSVEACSRPEQYVSTCSWS